MSYIHLHFFGRTTSPWHVGRTKYSDYLYTRRDYLWGRGIRGPVLRQLWRAYCPKSDTRDNVAFSPEKDCSNCGMAEDCPFNNLRGTLDEGEFKDKPRLIITNLRFFGNKVKRIPLATLDDKHQTVVPGRAPVFIEYLPEGTGFDFETILMSDGARFSNEFESAVKISLKFHGWGGFCNEGFGRGEIIEIRRHTFEEFEHKYVKPNAQKIMEITHASFFIEPLLILDKDSGGYYRSILEQGFKEKLVNSLNERFWQFYGRHVYVRLNRVSGLARTTSVSGWSRKTGGRIPFVGIGNELTLEFSAKPGEEEAVTLAIARYGIGRYKNQGFGSLRLIDGMATYP